MTGGVTMLGFSLYKPLRGHIREQGTTISLVNKLIDLLLTVSYYCTFFVENLERVLRLEKCLIRLLVMSPPSARCEFQVERLTINFRTDQAMEGK